MYGRRNRLDEVILHYDESSEITSAVDWLRGLITEEDWIRRRTSVLEGIRASNSRSSSFYEVGSTNYPTDDLAAFIMLTGEQSDQPAGGGWYNPMSGARILPQLAALGRAVPFISRIDGFEKRALRMLNEERAQPFAIMFELLLAAAYIQQGWREIRFLEESKRSKSPDFLATRRGRTWSVEAKRMMEGEYSNIERQAFREMFAPAAELAKEKRRFLRVDVDFHNELKVTPKTWLVDIVAAALQAGTTRYARSDEFGSVTVEPIYIAVLENFLRRDAVLFGDARFLELALGVFNQRVNHVASGSYQPMPALPRYIDRMGDYLIVARWRSASPPAIWAKSRNILNRLKDAAGQILDGQPGAVHVGIEALDGDATELIRDTKTKRLIGSFDARGKPLAWIYCHIFRPLVPPQGGWTIDETTSWWRMAPSRTRHPLPAKRMLLPLGTKFLRGGHWLHPIDRE